MDSSEHPDELLDNEKDQSATIDNPDPDTKQASDVALGSELISAGSQHLQRKLGGKEVQLYAVGGAIGTCMSLWMDAYPSLTICAVAWIESVI